MSRLQSVLRKQWFLVALGILIPGGLATGISLDADRVDVLLSRINPRIVTAAVLFLMSFSLNSRQLRNSFSRPIPVLWASFVNYGFIPLFGLLLMKLQQTDDFASGLMIAATVPCTMAAASVWTRRAGGNDAVSLLVTMLTNGICFLVTPAWLSLVTDSSVDLGFAAMVARLAYSVLLPCLVGQLLRAVPAAGEFATERKTKIGVIAQALILVLVFSAACRAGGRLALDIPGPSVLAVAIVWGSCIVLHLVAMAVAIAGAQLLGITEADRRAVAFAGSQKTLPIGVLLAEELGRAAGIPFAVFPMLMYHASQLFIDTAIADRMTSGDSNTG